MKKGIGDKYRSYIVCILFCLALFSIFIGVSQGQKQDDNFAEDFRLFQRAEGYKTMGDVSATPIIRLLVDKYPNNYNLLWDYAQILASQGEFSTAAEYFSRVRLQHPFILNNQDYLLQYSQMLIKLKQFSKAEKYLKHAREITTDIQVIKQIDQTLMTIKITPVN